MSTPTWNIETNSDFTAESGTAVGLSGPPATVAARVTARTSAGYPQRITLPAPVWFTIPGTSTAIPGGAVTPLSIQLFWKSEVGLIPAGSKMPPLPPTSSADPNNKGSKGLQALGVGGHNIYVNGATNPSLRLRGAETNVTVTGYWSTATPPVWVPLAPSTTYAFVVEACDNTLVGSGNKSASQSVTTPAASTTTQNVTLPPNPPGGVTLTAPLPVITTSGGGPISLTWNRIGGATTYEVWDNNTAGDTLVMDPSNPGFYIGDVRINAAVSQPALPATQVTVNTPNYTAPSTPVRIKVRAIRTDSNGTAYSSFSPTMYATIPAALNAPAVPTVAAAAGTGHNINITITPGTVSSSFGPAAYYKVYDGTTLRATVTPPLSNPYVLTYSAGSIAYSITVVAFNSKGQSAASTAATGTTA